MRGRTVATRPSQRRPPALPFGVAWNPLGVRNDAVFTALDDALEDLHRFVSCRRFSGPHLLIWALEPHREPPVLRKSRWTASVLLTINSRPGLDRGKINISTGGLARVEQQDLEQAAAGPPF
jgi:hypothetical protein